MHGLVVDDETALELLVKQKLRRKIRESTCAFGFATNGREALERMAGRIIISEAVYLQVNESFNCSVISNE